MLDFEPETSNATWVRAYAAYVKALSDATKAVRERGAAALHKLAALSTRVEPLLVELNGALLAAEAGVQHALLSAIAGVLRGMPKAVGEGTLQALQHCRWLCEGSAS